MKKLDRTLATIPVCLSKFHYPRHGWNNVKSSDKKLIWNKIDLIQERFCVYCEMPAAQGNDTTGHIEHFYNKGNVNYKHLTFDWNNLFGCCPSTHHCGHFKDQLINGVPRVYDANLLVKPDVDDPNEYLQFLSTGNVEPKEDLDVNKLNRARVTIDILNLDCALLIASRSSVIKNFQERVLALDELKSNSSIDEDEYIQLYLEIQSDVSSSIHRTAVAQVIFN
ncbi:retron Ec78 anti-phage system effector HNH endonuclease PtuB [Aeromonas hydrophila]|uniref:retron Ec78 anti-phage system effector HNH endonuclease PtuB n=1 Tax=Aeromonas hydrophila TaxID=644 RepID=UPI003986B9B5